MDGMTRREMFRRAVAAVVLGPAAVSIAASVKVPGGGISIPFATLPINTYIKGPRYSLMFGRLAIPLSENQPVALRRPWVADLLPDSVGSEFEFDGFA